MMDKLANLELSFLAVLLCIFGILLIIGFTILGLYLYLGSKSKSDLASKYEGKKIKSPIVAAGQYPDVNPFRWRGTLISFGIALALLTTLVSFGATQYDEEVFIPEGALDLDEEIEVEPPRTSEPPPPPPPPPPPVIEEVAEEELEEEDDIEFTDEDIDEDEVIEEIVEEEAEEEEEVEVVEVEEEEEEEIFMIVEQAPRFPGCEDIDGSKADKEACAEKKMLEYIYGNLKYPAIARENGIEGGVVIQFVVDKDGSINDIKLARDLEGGCGEAAVKVVNGMNNLPQKWTPGKQRGRAVKVKYTLPIKFKLEG